MPSIIDPGNEAISCFFGDQSSVMLEELEGPKVDEYTDDDDPGFELYEVNEKDFARVAKQLADNFGFPDRAVNPK
jgi:hypothetical protein